MRWAELGQDWGIALIAGYLATRVTDRAQRALWRVTPDCEKAREPATRDQSSAQAAARLLCHWGHIEPTDARLRRLKKVVHYGLGLGWGGVYGWLRRNRRVDPLSAGVITGLSLSLVVDETLNPVLGITPPPQAYPTSSHLRGLATHLVYGLTVAVAAEGLHRLASPTVAAGRGARLPEPGRSERTAGAAGLQGPAGDHGHHPDRGDRPAAEPGTRRRQLRPQALQHAGGSGAGRIPPAPTAGRER